jgi:hypothetical protein
MGFITSLFLFMSHPELAPAALRKWVCVVGGESGFQSFPHPPHKRIMSEPRSGDDFPKGIF